MVFIIMFLYIFIVSFSTCFGTISKSLKISPCMLNTAQSHSPAPPKKGGAKTQQSEATSPSPWKQSVLGCWLRGTAKPCVLSHGHESELALELGK